MPDEHPSPEEPKFQEWMVNYALNKRLRESQGGMQWFFGLKPMKASQGSTIAELCGFGWKAEETEWACETGLALASDLGGMDLAKFKEQYWATRPDFRFWTKDRTKQLIVEGKGVGCRPEKDDYAFAQAQRYFRYLADTGASGAVLYLAPETHVDGWFRKLVRASGTSRIPYGVMGWSDEFMSGISIQLILVISSGPLAAAATLLRIAAGYATRRPGAANIVE